MWPLTFEHPNLLLTQNNFARSRITNSNVVFLIWTSYKSTWDFARAYPCSTDWVLWWLMRTRMMTWQGHGGLGKHSIDLSLFPSLNVPVSLASAQLLHRSATQREQTLVILCCFSSTDFNRLGCIQYLTISLTNRADAAFSTAEPYLNHLHLLYLRALCQQEPLMKLFSAVLTS